MHQSPGREALGLSISNVYSLALILEAVRFIFI